jgi:TetR/AcrR family transcriptional regulator, fatty acid metabolism regulator protein
VSQRQSKSEEAGSRENERRHTILRAAIDVFARKGYHGCRIADVAREAGVAYGLVYHYFKNKDELLETVAATGWSGFVSRMRAVAEDDSSSLAHKVHGLAEVAFEAYRVDPRAVKVLILEIARSPAGGHVVSRQQAFLDAIRMAADMFARAQAAGQLRAELNPMLCASLLFGSLELGLTAFVSGLMEDRGPEALERARKQIADSFLRGVLPEDVLREGSWMQESSTPTARPKASKRA